MIKEANNDNIIILEDDIPFKGLINQKIKVNIDIFKKNILKIYENIISSNIKYINISFGKYINLENKKR